MTLEEFHSLCRQEWAEEHGEIITLWLTQDSYRELQQYAREMPVLYKEDSGAAHTASRWIWNQAGNPTQVGVNQSTVVNPVTNTPVRMKLARDKDAIEAFSGNAKHMYAKVLP